MRILILSDIHANLTALEAVLDAAGDYGAVWCLGDTVGYGPDPNECVETVRSLPGLVCVLGNHDAAVVGELESQSFNPEARASIEWTLETLTDENRDFIADLPKMEVIGEVTLVHGSPRDPTYEYLLDRLTATLNFGCFETPYSFFGHTHIPTIFQLSSSFAELYTPHGEAEFELQPRLMINPGSVGQPRDRDPRAAFAMYDTKANTWAYRRVPYDIESVQQRMENLGLPEKHVLRLASGW